MVIWLHLKDFPSRFGILVRKKNEKLPSQVLIEGGIYIVEYRFLKSKSISQLKGEKFEVIYTEVRYVHPIKGDKIGRVTYQKIKTLRIKY